MHGRPGVGKKRKYEVDLDAERTLYTGFVAAANSVSQLYTQAVQQQRRASAAASRQALERVICFVLRECSGAEMLPKSLLLQFLQQEYENLEGGESAPHQFPVQMLPTMSQQQQQQQAGAASDDGAAMDAINKGARGATPATPSSAPSPGRRGAGHGGGAMDVEGAGGQAAQGPGGGGLFLLDPSQQQQQGGSFGGFVPPRGQGAGGHAFH